MTLYLVKAILCSGLLYAAYALLLEKEKFHHLKRWYLLSALLFSLLVPFIELPSRATALSFTPPAATGGAQVVAVVEGITEAAPPVPGRVPFDTGTAIVTLYLLVTGGLLLRFAGNCGRLFITVRRHATTPFRKATVVLCNGPVVPHSFLHYIFLNRDDFEHHRIEPEVLAHEAAHVRQRHTLDILLVEGLQVFFWFNPFLQLYKKAIRLNHEFLADDQVLRQFADTPAYQQLLLSRAVGTAGSVLGSRLNFSLTKKRFQMMSRTTSPLTAAGKQLLLLPLLGAAVFLFGIHDAAQAALPEVQHLLLPQDTVPGDKKQPGLAIVGPALPDKGKGVSPELLEEYNAIIERHRGAIDRWHDSAKKGKLVPIFSDADRARLETIYRQMSREQKSRQSLVFLAPAKPWPVIVPTRAQFEAFKNPGVYGIWIDNKRVSNAVLNNYKNTDFSHVFISKLYGAAKKGRVYDYQVDLMTNAHYKAYKRDWKPEAKATMLFRKDLSRK